MLSLDGFIASLVSAAFVLSITACQASAPCGGQASCEGTGGSGATSTSSGPTSGTGASTSTELTCCINQAGYTCPSQSAFDKCSGGEVAASQCHAKCGADAECHSKCDALIGNPDPSSCHADSKVTCGSPTGPNATSSGTGAGTCHGVAAGNCQVDSDCFSGDHCTFGKCYPDAASNPCNIDEDCGSLNHCTKGCCFWNGAGSPCDIDSDCGLGSCVNGTCSG